MSINTTITKNEYVGNGITTDFPIGFEYTDAGTISPTVDGVIAPFAYDNALTPTTVIFALAPVLGAAVLVQRITPRTQNSEFNENQIFSDRAVAIEDQFDRLVQMVQELEVGGLIVVAPTSDNSAIFQMWEISTNYLKNQLLRDGLNGKYYTVVADYASNAVNIGADITSGDLELFNQGEKGEKGDKGDNGNNGVDGGQGIQGIPGNDGVDGLIIAIASQAEAEAGVNDSKAMTPLKVKQAIDSQVADIITNTGLASDLADLTQLVQEINSELQMLKAATSQTLGRYAGRQRINQNQLVALAIDVDSNEKGVGSPLKFNSVGTEFVHLQMYIRRGNISSTNFEVVAQFINGQWFLCRKENNLLDETLEFDGVTLTIETTGNEGQVKYISETVAGPYNEDEHYISWIGQEIRQGVLL